MRVVRPEWMLPCCLGLACTAAAQEEIPRSPSQLSAPPATSRLENVDETLAAPGAAPSKTASLLRWGPVNARPHVIGRITYGDGIQAQPGNQSKTLTESISPGVLLEIGRLWKLDYTPTLTFYSDKAFKDTLGHSVVFFGGTTYGGLSLNLSQAYAATSDPLIETARQTDQETYTTDIGGLLYFNSGFMLEMSGHQEFRFAEALNSSKTWSTTEFLNYQLSPRLGVAIGGGAGYNKVTVGSDTMYEMILGRITSRVANKLNLSINGGIDIVQFVNGPSGSLLIPIYGAAVDYRPFEFTTITLSGNRTITPSLFQDLLTESTDISLALNQRLFGLLYATISGGFRNTAYLSTTSAGATNREDETANLMGSLSYSFWRKLSSTIYYQYAQNTSSSTGFSFTSSQVGLILNYSF
jgi:hypothetical protein